MTAPNTAGSPGTPASAGRRASRFLGGQNLRRRLTLAVGIFTAVAVTLFGATVWVVVGYNLSAAVDNDLRATAELIQAIGESGFDDRNRDSNDGSDGAGIPATGPNLEELSRLPAGEGRPPIPYVQVLDETGTVQVGDGGIGRLPVSEQARAVAFGTSDEHVEFIDVDNRSVRLMTVSLDGNQGRAALQIGTDVTNMRDGLRRARVGTLLAGLAAGLGAAAMAWLFSRRLIAPVRAVAEAADRLRSEGELPERLAGEGPDELGHLITSFNALLDDVSDSRSRQRRLVADASHELRTPLTSLRLKIEFIQAEPDLPLDERQRLVAGAVADLRSLGDLVSELAELAAEGATGEQPVLTDLGGLVEAEVARFAATSGRRVDVSTSSGVIETRPKQITRALTNLLINADKYSPADQPIEVSQIGPRIEVRDHGDGIAIEERERVFDRFHRGRAHQSIEGSGLGLAIVESMARANGGETWIADPDDGGAGVVVGFTAGPTDS